MPFHTYAEFYTQTLRQMPFLWLAIWFWLGCNIGSFLNVCIYRIPIGMSLLYPPSHCPNCNHKIRFYENIPLFAYVFLGGKCSGCKQKISPRYFLVELLTGILFAAVFLSVYAQELPFSLMLFFFFLVSIAICVGFTDADLRIIPNELTFCSMIVSLAFWCFFTRITRGVYQWELPLYYLLSGAGFWLFLALFARIGKQIKKRRVLGGGDIKYIASLALAFGAFDTLFIVLFGCIAGLLAIPLLHHFKRKKRHQGIAFGPYLAGAAVLWILCGNWIRCFFIDLCAS